MDEPGRAQHVLGHAFAPLAACLGRGQGLAQRVGGLRQPGRHLAGGLEPRGDVGQSRSALLVELGHQAADPFELGLHLGQATAHGLVALVELLGPGSGLGPELLGGHRDHGLDRGVQRLLALVLERAALGGQLVTELVDERGVVLPPTGGEHGDRGPDEGGEQGQEQRFHAGRPRWSRRRGHRTKRV